MIETRYQETTYNNSGIVYQRVGVEIKGTKFTVSRVNAGSSHWWNVYREPKGMQRNIIGKDFHKFSKIAEHYKTLREVLPSLFTEEGQVRDHIKAAPVGAVH